MHPVLHDIALSNQQQIILHVVNHDICLQLNNKEASVLLLMLKIGDVACVVLPETNTFADPRKKAFCGSRASCRLRSRLAGNLHSAVCSSRLPAPRLH